MTGGPNLQSLSVGEVLVQGSSSTRLRRLDLAVSKLASSDFALRATPVLWPEAGPGLRSPLLGVLARPADGPKIIPKTSVVDVAERSCRRRRAPGPRLLTNQNLHYRNTYLSTREPPGGTRFPPA